MMHCTDNGDSGSLPALGSASVRNPSEAAMGENWTGIEGSTEHRTVGGRAWCYQDNEWCYPQKPTSPMSLEHCDCCMEAAGYEKRWVPATEGGNDE
jgi:hypothetical protein